MCWQRASGHHPLCRHHSGGLECVGAHVVNYRLSDIFQLKLINYLAPGGRGPVWYLRCRVKIPCISFVFDYKSWQAFHWGHYTVQLMAIFFCSYFNTKLPEINLWYSWPSVFLRYWFLFIRYRYLSFWFEFHLELLSGDWHIFCENVIEICDFLKRGSP